DSARLSAHLACSDSHPPAPAFAPACKLRKKDILNAEQLNSARLARWSQNGEARLTLEAASEWLSAIGFCPYLPLRTIPAPSFVEAVVGRPAPLPSAGERSRANELFVRLVENALA